MNLSLCPYKNLFGKPSEGIHKYRFFDIAFFDVIGTIVVSYFIAQYIKQDFKMVLTISILLAIILHRLFCVRTTIDKLLFR